MLIKSNLRCIINNIKNIRCLCTAVSVPKVLPDGPKDHSRYLPVFAKEINNSLKLKDGNIYLDLTFGSGGHTKHLLSSGKDIKVIAIDRDPVAYKKAIDLAKETSFQVLPMCCKFSEVPSVLKYMGIKHNQLHGQLIIFNKQSTNCVTWQKV